MEHHTLDPYPIPKEKTSLYVNEPWLMDKSLVEELPHPEPEEQADNIRIYVPIDLNRKAILRRLERLIVYYGEANEENEFEFQSDVSMLISQIEIYDQVWYVRHMPENGNHSEEAIALVKEVISRLEDISDGCAECFPFDIIEELKRAYC